MTEEKKVYGFTIRDTDNKYSEYTYMLYTKQKNFLKPVVKLFEQGHKDTFTIDQLVACLNHNQINKLYTYTPLDDYTLCIQPYEIINDEDLKICEYDGYWQRYTHLEISLTQREKSKFAKNKIELKTLTQKEIQKLEKTLKHHY